MIKKFNYSLLLSAAAEVLCQCPKRDFYLSNGSSIFSKLTLSLKENPIFRTLSQILSLSTKANLMVNLIRRVSTSETKTSSTLSLSLSLSLLTFSLKRRLRQTEQSVEHSARWRGEERKRWRSVHAAREPTLLGDQGGRQSLVAGRSPAAVRGTCGAGAERSSAAARHRDSRG